MDRKVSITDRIKLIYCDAEEGGHGVLLLFGRDGGLEKSVSVETRDELRLHLHNLMALEQTQDELALATVAA